MKGGSRHEVIISVLLLLESAPAIAPEYEATCFALDIPATNRRTQPPPWSGLYI